MNKRLIQLAISLFAVVAMASSTALAAQNGTAQGTQNKFFIISSVNMQKQQMQLSMPSEVTMRMSITGKTSIVDQKGKHLSPSDLRSGDTAYITYRQTGSGEEALSIRLGPMTVPELRQRYLGGTAVPVPAPSPAPTQSATPRPRPAATQRGQQAGR